MLIPRRYTTTGQDPFKALRFVPRSSRIVNPDGSVVFEMNDLQAPESWSQVAVDILAQKYFRRAGVPAAIAKVAEDGVPLWLQRSVPAAGATLGQETDARQVFRRLAGCWTYWGWKGGYFSSEADAQAFFDENCYMLAAQMAAPNSPQWFNTGLYWAYGIEGPPQGHYFVDPKTGAMTRSTSAYEHPAPHACFIQSVQDDLVNEGGIMDLWVREARIFKYGAGTGSNFSAPARRGRAALRRRQVERADELSARSATGPPAPSSRAAPPAARPRWWCSISIIPTSRNSSTGRWSRSKRSPPWSPARSTSDRHLNAILKACHDWPVADERCDRKRNGNLRSAIADALADLVPANYIERDDPPCPAGLHVGSDRRVRHRLELQGVLSPCPARTATTRSASPTSSWTPCEKDGPWHLYWRTENGESPP